MCKPANVVVKSRKPARKRRERERLKRRKEELDRIWKESHRYKSNL